MPRIPRIVLAGFYSHHKVPSVEHVFPLYKLRLTFTLFQPLAYWLHILNVIKVVLSPVVSSETVVKYCYY